MQKKMIYFTLCCCLAFNFVGCANTKEIDETHVTDATETVELQATESILASIETVDTEETIESVESLESETADFLNEADAESIDLDTILSSIEITSALESINEGYKSMGVSLNMYAEDSDVLAYEITFLEQMDFNGLSYDDLKANLNGAFDSAVQDTFTSFDSTCRLSAIHVICKNADGSTILSETIEHP